MNTVIRPLSIDDARLSYKWRNDAEIWKYTGKRPDHVILYEDELKWIKDVLSRANERRFAIIADGTYVGNIQLTDIAHDEAVYHIFIGEKTYWGKGVAHEATRLILAYAFADLKLKAVRLRVRTEHERAIRLYLKAGFEERRRDDEFVYMTIEKT